MDELFRSILDRYEKVLAIIEKAAILSGRKPESINLLAVTKGHKFPVLQAAYDIGLRNFGENYVEEALVKMDQFQYPVDIQWHMIGHLQSRKTRKVSESFDWFQSLDRMKIAELLSKNCQEMKKELPVLLECNVSGEESKYGWPAWDETAWGSLADEFCRLIELPGIQVRGLMTMAPFFEKPELARPYFSRLKKLRDFLSQKVTSITWDELSMGMSADFEIAIEEGSTIVRLGTALFGARPQV